MTISVTDSPSVVMKIARSPRCLPPAEKLSRYAIPEPPWNVSPRT